MYYYDVTYIFRLFLISVWVPLLLAVSIKSPQNTWRRKCGEKRLCLSTASEVLYFRLIFGKKSVPPRSHSRTKSQPTSFSAAPRSRAGKTPPICAIQAQIWPRPGIRVRFRAGIAALEGRPRPPEPALFRYGRFVFPFPFFPPFSGFFFGGGERGWSSMSPNLNFFFMWLVFDEKSRWMCVV